MPICPHCDSPFPNRQLIDGKTRNFSKRKYCLQCSPFGGHNTNQTIENRFLRQQGKRRCSLCKSIKSLSEFYHSKDKIYTYCKPCDRERQIRRKRELKAKAVEYAGGACAICGYSRFNGALAFHHRSSEEKEFGIARAKGDKLTAKLKREIDKCVLLCVRCHCEVHGGIVEI